MQRLMWGWI